MSKRTFSEANPPPDPGLPPAVNLNDSEDLELQRALSLSQQEAEEAEFQRALALSVTPAIVPLGSDGAEKPAKKFKPDTAADTAVGFPVVPTQPNPPPAVPAPVAAAAPQVVSAPGLTAASQAFGLLGNLAMIGSELASSVQIKDGVISVTRPGGSVQVGGAGVVLSGNGHPTTGSGGVGGNGSLAATVPGLSVVVPRTASAAFDAAAPLPSVNFSVPSSGQGVSGSSQTAAYVGAAVDTPTAADVQNMADALIPLPIKFARRPAGVPVGLPNLGNTCYVNCVLQILFHTAPAIVRAVLIWEPPPAAAPNAGGGGGDGARVRRAVEALRLIFVYMICTDRCYVEAHLLDTLRRALGLDETQHDINLIFITLLDTLRIALQTADSDLVGDLYFGRLSRLIRFAEESGREPLREDLEGGPGDVFQVAVVGFDSVHGALDANMRDHIDGATPPRTVTLAFERVPSVVQLVLKRFEWTSTGSRKVNDVLPVPMSLNMARIHRDSEALTVRRNDLVASIAELSEEARQLEAVEQHLDGLPAWVAAVTAESDEPALVGARATLDGLKAAHEAQARNVAERLAEARAELAAADAARPSTDAESTHELRAIVVHSGTVDAGHYYAYIRVAGSWYLFNDFNVTICADVDTMLNEVAGHKDGVSAYMLVYVDPSVAAEDAGVLRSEVPATLRTGVDNDNSLFAVAVTHWHEVRTAARATAVQVAADYQQRMIGLIVRREQPPQDPTFASVILRTASALGYTQSVHRLVLEACFRATTGYELDNVYTAYAGGASYKDTLMMEALADALADAKAQWTTRLEALSAAEDVADRMALASGLLVHALPDQQTLQLKTIVGVAFNAMDSGRSSA